MQIDTWNRAEMNIDGPFPPKFVPGPLPAASQAPRVNPEYSGNFLCLRASPSLFERRVV
jgi:hypothetical protein